MMDTLRALGEEEVLELQEMLMKDLPRSIHAYSYLKTALEWQTKRPNYCIEILAPFGDYSGATVVIKTTLMGAFFGTAYAGSEEGLRRLETSLRATNRVSWSEEFVFTCMEPLTAAVVRCVVEDLAPPRVTVHENKAYYLPPLKAAQLTHDSEDGTRYSLRELEASDLEQVNGGWPHKAAGLEGLVSDSLSLGGGVGVFEGEDRGRLLSWALVTFYGGVGLVRTAEGHARRGLASRAVTALANKMGDSGTHVHLNVLQGNRAGNKLFTKLGFQFLGTYTWIYRGIFPG